MTTKLDRLRDELDDLLKHAYGSRGWNNTVKSDLLDDLCSAIDLYMPWLDQEAP